MKAKLIIEGKEIEVEISQKEYEKLIKKKITGYERAAHNNTFYAVSNDGHVDDWVDRNYEVDERIYEEANYYTDKGLAEANARADKLMRNLRRFSAEHRSAELRWRSNTLRKWFIQYDYDANQIAPIYNIRTKYFGLICFETEEIAEAAIKEFHDELIWYFTEYKDSL